MRILQWELDTQRQWQLMIAVITQKSERANWIDFPCIFPPFPAKPPPAFAVTRRTRQEFGAVSGNELYVI